MKLINEDKLLELNANIFYRVLLEYLSMEDPIQKANYYWQKEHPDGKFNPKFLRSYVKQFPIADIKEDILSFVITFAKELKSNPNIDRILSYKSPDFGFSNYMHIYFKKPSDPKLKDYVLKNDKKYSNVKFRFSEHGEYSDTDEDKKAVKNVDYHNKNFIQASKEMLANINEYIAYLKNGENEYLEELRKKEDAKKKEISIPDIGKDQTEKTECLKLKIKEGVSLNEKLEEIANSTFATDLAGDIANWILNKPKAYRILYDKKYDVWVIADAMQNTHKDMSIDLFDSDYLYGVARHLDDDITKMREEDNLGAGWTDAEVYSDYGFDHYILKGLFFIPKHMRYGDYEESGFYSCEIPIKSGSIFVQRYSEFSDSGIFKDLYNKLDVLGAIPKPIKSIYIELRKKYDNIDEFLDNFYIECEKEGYEESECIEFLDRFGILNMVK